MYNKDLWKKCVEFHGHECPGLAIGFRACEIAKEKLNLKFSKDEEVVCITENDACGVDAIQVITGCTIGKGNLIYKGTGKMAFSFFDRKNNRSIRLILKDFNFNGSRDEKQNYIIDGSEKELFDIKTPSFIVPEYARSFNSIKCEICGELAPEHKIRIEKGKKVCLDCYNEYTRGW